MTAAALDYYAVYDRKNAKAAGSFLCHAHAHDRTHALRIARSNGMRPSRWAYAIHIGKAGYYASLKRAFPEPKIIQPKPDDHARHFSRGYFCAVAVYLKESCQEGVADTMAESLFRQAGDWQHADPEDIATFRLHKLIP